MPYDDLPETDEPLVELETPEEDTRCQLWEDTSPIINILSENTNGFQLESPKTPEKPVLSDLKGILAQLFKNIGIMVILNYLKCSINQNLFNNSLFKKKTQFEYVYLQIIGQLIRIGNHYTPGQRLERNVAAYGELTQEAYGLRHLGARPHLP